jgi:hypothetical protein
LVVVGWRLLFPKLGRAACLSIKWESDTDLCTVGRATRISDSCRLILRICFPSSVWHSGCASVRKVRIMDVAGDEARAVVKNESSHSIGKYNKHIPQLKEAFLLANSWPR